MTCLVDEGGELDFQFGVQTANGGQSNGGYTDASTGEVAMTSDTQPDSQGGHAGSWNTATFAQTFVASSNSHRVWLQLFASNCLGTIQVDNVQVLASFPVAKSSPLVVYPNCTGLPTAPFTSVNITSSTPAKFTPRRYYNTTINTYPNMAVVPSDAGSAVYNTGSLAACQKLLGSPQYRQSSSAQYNNSSGACTVYQGSLCSAYELLDADPSVFALGIASSVVFT